MYLIKIKGRNMGLDLMHMLYRRIATIPVWLLSLWDVARLNEDVL